VESININIDEINVLNTIKERRNLKKRGSGRRGITTKTTR
jgi:hypothetical protein